ncbi:MAG: type VI secretion system tube protein Hcp [Aquisalimonadaceae bacterium]
MAIYMNYPGVSGTCSDANHRGWLIILELEWGTQRRITSASSTRGDRESSSTRISDLTVTRVMDSATPALFIEACSGRGKEVVIRAGKTTSSGSGADVYLEYVLAHCLVKSYEMTASPQHGNRPMERLVLSFTKMLVRYTPYDSDGDAMAAMSVGYDTATNTTV